MDQRLPEPAVTDWRGLCAELAYEVEQCALDRGDLMPECADRARAALAQPEPEVVEPTDQELADAFAEGCRDGSKAGEPPFLGGARAVLARYGHQPAPPAEGEVGELVAWLRDRAESTSLAHNALRITRAADLLEQRHPAPVPVSEKPLAQETYIAFVQICKGNSDDAGTYEDDEKLVRSALKRLAELEVFPQRHPTPVPVSERLPEATDCDAEGRCWLFSKVEKEWRLIDVGNSGVPHLKYCFSHWLPFNALPLPQGEVQP